MTTQPRRKHFSELREVLLLSITAAGRCDLRSLQLLSPPARAGRACSLRGLYSVVSRTAIVLAWHKRSSPENVTAPCGTWGAGFVFPLGRQRTSTAHKPRCRPPFVLGIAILHNRRQVDGA